MLLRHSFVNTPVTLLSLCDSRSPPQTQIRRVNKDKNEERIGCIAMTHITPDWGRQLCKKYDTVKKNHTLTFKLVRCFPFKALLKSCNNIVNNYFLGTHWDMHSTHAQGVHPLLFNFILLTHLQSLKLMWFKRFVNVRTNDALLLVQSKFSALRNDFRKMLHSCRVLRKMQCVTWITSFLEKKDCP